MVKADLALIAYMHSLEDSIIHMQAGTPHTQTQYLATM